MRLANGLETLELGTTAWRVIINDNLEKIYTKNEVDLLSKGNDKKDFSTKNLSVSANVSVARNLSVDGNFSLKGMPEFAQTMPSASLGEPLGFIKVKVAGQIVKIPYFQE